MDRVCEGKTINRSGTQLNLAPWSNEIVSHAERLPKLDRIIVFAKSQCIEYGVSSSSRPRRGRR
jgi:hypothetical protein